MYPDDQGQTQQQNSLGEAPQPTSFGSPNQPAPKKPPKTMKIVLWAGCGFLVLLLLLVAVIWVSSASKDSKEPPASTSEEPEEESVAAGGCLSKERRYQSESLSLAFCYPNAWGNVSVQDAKLDPSDDGSRQKLVFSEKPQVTVGLVSDDWSTDVARDGVCSDPAQQELPNFESFSARWAAEGAGANITSATRGLEIATDEYIIEEHVDNLLTNGVCITGFNLTEGEVYRHAEAAYSVAFGGAITTPAAHINDPTELISVADRTAFTNFVKSMRAE